jgi:cytochrome b6-f complex iron-sulfur subunit
LGRGSLAAAIGAIAIQIVRFLSFQPPTSEESTLSLGTPDTYRRNTVTYVSQARVYVGRDNGGLYAIDAVCPHLGCLVQQADEEGFVCPCHDSSFSKDGQALTGPATEPLRFLLLSIDPQNDGLVVDRTQAVDPAVRLKT